MHLHVGNPESSSEIVDSLESTSATRATFPSMWPFGQQRSIGSHDYIISGTHREQERQRHALGNSEGHRNHTRGARTNADLDDLQSSDESASDDSDDEYNARAGIAMGAAASGAFGAGAGAGAYDSGKGKEKNSGKRRLSSTTEAKRRTSLEDDDDDDDEGEVVHVGRSEDEELVEIQHTEMQGVEGGETHSK